MSGSPVVRAWLRLALTLLLLGGVTVALPVLLAMHRLTPPVPHWTGSARLKELLSGNFSSADWRNVLVDIVWLGWLRFVLGTVAMGYLELKRQSTQHLRYLGISQSLVKELVRSKAVIDLGPAPGRRYVRLRGGVEFPPAGLPARRAVWAAEREGEGSFRRVTRAQKPGATWDVYDPAALWWADAVGRHLVAASGDEVGKSLRIMKVSGDGVDLFVERGAKVGGLFDPLDLEHGRLDWWAFDRTDRLARQIAKDVSHPFPDTRIVPIGVDDTGEVVLVNLGWTGPLQVLGEKALQRLSALIAGSGELPWLDALAVVTVGCDSATPVDVACLNIGDLRLIDRVHTSWMLIGGPVDVQEVVEELSHMPGLEEKALVVGGDADGVETPDGRQGGGSFVDADGVLMVDGVKYDLGI